jgi:hypothetical protein
MTTANFSYIDSQGRTKSGELKLEHYALAERHHIKTSQLINEVYADADPRFGSAFEQGARSLGIFTKGDPKYGITPTTIRDIVTGECMARQSAVQLATSPSGGGTIVSPMNPIGSSTPASRVFFPEVIMSMMEETLKSDYSPEMAIFNSMLASDESIASEVFTQPVINTTAPESVRSMPISQNALPRNMVSITASQTSKAIATTSVGLQIADQAMQHATVDLVAIILAAQMEGEMKAKLWEDLAAVVAGNVDAGQSALTPIAGTTYDSNMTGGVVTQKGWMKMLHDPSRTISIDSIICALDDLIAIQGRTGRPLIFDPKTSGANLGNVGNAVYNVEPMILNYGVAEPKIMIVPDGLWSANGLLCFDSRYALRRVTNTSASYQAIEQMVLQRSTFMRIDSGSMVYRLYDDAFRFVDFT